MTIRTYMRRSGRITRAQRRALDTLWPRYVLEENIALDLDKIFNRCAPRYLEIGFGMGDTLLEMAKAHPQNDYLGIEVYRPGVGKLLACLEAETVSNVRIICADAVPVLENRLEPDSVDVVYLFFPDPWPKKKHHKRRIVQADFAKQISKVLKPEGCLYMGTDWEDYARHMLQVMEAEEDFSNLVGPACFSPRPPERPLTKFERRGQRFGYEIWDLAYQKRP
ncbi:MAG: tRNA (guanosine(46)-N7)-methyltransferase TrmB [Gammaproteobacteria bacterium]|nr:tRNA (guanosine(46)-N7)-methyltransferase TrmB [Gammaproteobacteria bacterium]